MNKLLDYPCPVKTKMSIQHLTSLQRTGLKFLSLGFNALLQGSSEHYDMQDETMGGIMFDEGHQSKYINKLQAVLHCWMLSDDDMAYYSNQCYKCYW